MDKEAIKNYDLSKITRGYQNTVGQYPAAEAALGAGVGGLGGYLGGGFIAKKTLDMLLAGKSPAEKAAVMQKLKQDGTMGLIKGITGTAGLLAGAAYPLYLRGDTSKGPGRFLDSVLIPEYAKRHPERIKALAAKTRKDFINKRYTGADVEAKRAMFDTGRMDKTGAVNMLDDPFVRERVPLGYTMDLIEQDPFLTMTQKQQVNGVLNNAENSDTGLASGKDLMRGALRAGVGLATGYAFGQVAGKMFSLPKDVTKKLSNVGAVAGGIANTGIFQELGR